MTELEIPEEADEFRFYCADKCGRMGFEVEALPYVVAAELERLVDETDWAWAVGSSLRDRATELRNT